MPRRLDDDIYYPVWWIDPDRGGFHPAFRGTSGSRRFFVALHVAMWAGPPPYLRSATLEQLVESVHLTPRTLRQHLAALVDVGILRTTPDGWSLLTDDPGVVDYRAADPAP